MGNLVINLTTTPLNNGQTFTSPVYEVGQYNSITITGKTDRNGKLYIDHSIDGNNFDYIEQCDIEASVFEKHKLSVFQNYVRFRIFNDSGNNQVYCRFQAIATHEIVNTRKINSEIQGDEDIVINKSIIAGQQDSGNFTDVSIDPNGHLEVAVHSPRLPFGSMHTEHLTPIFQSDAVYGVNPVQVLSIQSGSGVASNGNSMFSVSTGTTIYSQAVHQSRKRLRYRAGQGVVGRFTSIFTAPVANSYQLCGFGHAEDGIYVGYGNTNDLSDTEFGILYVKNGVREVKTLTVTTGATSAGNVTITLNGTAFTAAVTNSSNIQRTVWEISQGTFTGWDAYPSGATVVFVRNSAGTTAGTQSFSAGTTGSAATIAQTKAGAASTDIFYPQSEWNGDKLDGTGPSAVTIDPTKGNVWQVDIQYLGFGAIVIKCEIAPAGNNPDFVTVHTLPLPNTLTGTSFGNPSFPFTAAVYSAGSTTDLTVKVGSFAGFIEGQKKLHGNRLTYYNQLTTVGASNFQALFTIMNTRYFAGRSNQAVINLVSVMGAIKHTSPVVFYIIKNGSLVGNPNFQVLSSSSCSLWDTAATTVTYSTGEQLLWTGHLGDTGELDHHFDVTGLEEFTLQPGEWITLAAKSTTGTPSYVTGSINTREDQ